MFKHKTTKSYQAEVFNHCSSVHSLKGVQTLAWYSGKECEDSQSVYIVNPSLNDKHKVIVGSKTGNPILFDHGGKTFLIYSKFESDRKGVLRWQDCSLWISQLEVSKRKQPIILSHTKIADHSLHLLARCNPIKHGSKTLIPLYDEKEAKNVMMSMAEDNITPKIEYSYGQNNIQHTLFSFDDSVFSLSRNFRSYDDISLSQISNKSSLYDLGGMRPGANYRESPLYNLNSSIHAVNWGNEIFLLWNRKNKKMRTNLSLGKAKMFVDDGGYNIEVIETIDLTGEKRGSYPSMCVDNNKLYFAYTDDNYDISYNVWNKRQFRFESKRGDIVS